MRKIYTTFFFCILALATSAQLNQWTWINGDSSVNSTGTYGTLGTPAASNEPGARELGYTWTDASGNLWMFGGFGYHTTTTIAELNDLWRYNIATNQWTWVAGDNSGDNAGVFGTQGTPAAGNKPSGRDGGAFWKDGSGNFWLFGGYGNATGTTQGNLNDLWRYNPSTNQWTWMKGDNTLDVAGVFGTQGTAAATNKPGARWLPGCWGPDASGNFWLFGGSDAVGYLNDLWRYNPSTNQWTWINGDNTNDVAGVYGTLGTPAAGNKPGARMTPSTWRDASGNLWLFGGENSTTVSQLFNDLWRYNPSTNQWTWISGSNAVNQTAVYGTQGTPAAGNVPGCRRAGITWTDANGNLWMYGGYGYAATATLGRLNDVWRFDVSTNQWTWMSGNNTVGVAGVYGSIGVTSATNKPGGRYWGCEWADNGSSSIYVFGGRAIGNSALGNFNDLWKYNVSFPTAINNPAFAAPELATYPNPATDFVTITISGNNTTAKYTYQITDVNGKIMLERKNAAYSQVFNVRSYGKGMYFVNVLNAAGSAIYHAQFIKQ